MLNKIVVLIYLASGAFAISTNVTVGTLGNVIGLKETTKWTNKTIYAFRGIPYAEPPTGDLRFRVGCFRTSNYLDACSEKIFEATVIYQSFATSSIINYIML